MNDRLIRRVERMREALGLLRSALDGLEAQLFDLKRDLELSSASPSEMAKLNQMTRPLSIHEACRFLGISRGSLYKLIKSGKLETVLIGSRRVVLADALRVVLTTNEPIAPRGRPRKGLQVEKY